MARVDYDIKEIVWELNKISDSVPDRFPDSADF